MFDFNRFVPYPPEWREMDRASDAWWTASLFDSNPPPSAYHQWGVSWCVQNWGTTQNARDAAYATSTLQGGCLDAWVRFCTDRAAPRPVVRRAAELFPDLELDLFSLEPTGYDDAVHFREGVETDTVDWPDLPFHVRVIDPLRDVPLHSIAAIREAALELVAQSDSTPEFRRKVRCRAAAVSEWLDGQFWPGRPDACVYPKVDEITAHEARLGLCPECRWVDRSFELAAERWAVCDTHRVRWCVDRGLSPNRNVEILPDWWLDERHFGEYREVVPIRVLGDPTLT